MKSELLDAFGEYLSENCDQYGNIRAKNMTREEISGMKNLQNRVWMEYFFFIKTDTDTMRMLYCYFY